MNREEWPFRAYVQRMPNEALLSAGARTDVISLSSTLRYSRRITNPRLEKGMEKKLHLRNDHVSAKDDGQVSSEPASTVSRLFSDTANEQSLSKDFPTPYCLGPTQVASYTQTGKLTADEERHRDACVFCRALLEVLVPDPVSVQIYREDVIARRRRMEEEARKQETAAGAPSFWRRFGLRSWPISPLAGASALAALILLFTMPGYRFSQPPTRAIPPEAKATSPRSSEKPDGAQAPYKAQDSKPEETNPSLLARQEGGKKLGLSAFQRVNRDYPQMRPKIGRDLNGRHIARISESVTIENDKDDSLMKRLARLLRRVTAASMNAAPLNVEKIPTEQQISYSPLPARPIATLEATSELSSLARIASANKKPVRMTLLYRNSKKRAKLDVTMNGDGQLTTGSLLDIASAALILSKTPEKLNKHQLQLANQLRSIWTVYYSQTKSENDSMPPRVAVPEQDLTSAELEEIPSMYLASQSDAEAAKECDEINQIANQNQAGVIMVWSQDTANCQTISDNSKKLKNFNVTINPAKDYAVTTRVLDALNQQSPSVSPLVLNDVFPGMVAVIERRRKGINHN